MAIETLRDVDRIGGFRVSEKDEKGFQAHPLNGDEYIEINHQENSIKFTIQKGPIKENGMNGCQVDTLIAAALKMITKMNASFPCKENEAAMLDLASALSHLEDRRKDRERRGVEGLNKE